MFIKPISHRDTTSFGYHHYLKNMYREGYLPTVKRGFYGEQLTVRNVSLEHLKPKSKGGACALNNYALTSVAENNKRGCDDIRGFINPKNVVAYLDQFKNVNVNYKGGIKFSGNRYIEMILTTLKNLGVAIANK